MKSLDTETTGVDLHHGALPFFVTVGREDGSNVFWEWDVNPLTRQPIVPEGDLEEVAEEIADEELVLQNPKFDYQALGALGFDVDHYWNWKLVKDTLLAGHLLGSNQPHDLTSMAMVYLGVNILPYEMAVKEAVKQARVIARTKYKDWMIAKEGMPNMPSLKDSAKNKKTGKDDETAAWKNDYWLPRAIAKVENYPEDHPWWTVLRDYGNADSLVTLPLWRVQEKHIEARKLTKIYKERLKLLPIVCGIESVGVTLNKDRLDEKQNEYVEESQSAGRICVNIAKTYNYDLKLPKGASPNNSLRNFVFDILKLPPVKTSDKTGAPSLDKDCIDDYIAQYPTDSKESVFMTTLKGKRSRDTAMSYMTSYRRFWIPLGIFNEKGEQLWFRLHPSLNMTGTDTLRWSSSNPNEQNISKKEGFNLRYCFGPAPGREWWSCDAQNIELRIPAYEAGEQAMIDLFERPNDPPYFGSNHLLAAHTLHPEKFEALRNADGVVDGRLFKKKYAATWYQWVKNGNFAVQYGAVETSGTADRAYHVPGAQAKIAERLGKIADLNRAMIAHAEKFGYVETMPDRNVDPARGYPLLCTRSTYGKILPTVPLSYHVQGTAMWWMMKAMIRVQEYFDTLNKGRDPANGYYMVMQVHDELVFDFPVGTGPEPWKTNLQIIREVQRLMALGGEDLGIPTPVSCEYHADNWSEGRSI